MYNTQTHTYMHAAKEIEITFKPNRLNCAVVVIDGQNFLLVVYVIVICHFCVVEKLFRLCWDECVCWPSKNGDFERVCISVLPTNLYMKKKKEEESFKPRRWIEIRTQKFNCRHSRYSSNETESEQIAPTHTEIGSNAFKNRTKWSKLFAAWWASVGCSIYRSIYLRVRCVRTCYMCNYVFRALFVHHGNRRI